MSGKSNSLFTASFVVNNCDSGRALAHASCQSAIHMPAAGASIRATGRTGLPWHSSLRIPVKLHVSIRCSMSDSKAIFQIHNRGGNY